MLKLNETPVRTSRNFNINNIKLENIEIPEVIPDFENVTIIGDTSKINIEGIAASVNTIIEKISSLIINYTGNAISFVPIFFIVFIITVLSAYFMLKEDFSINLIYFEKYNAY